MVGAAAHAQAPAIKPAALTVWAQDALSPTVVATIAAIGAPKTITLKDDDSVRSIIERRCGIVHPAYTKAFLVENLKKHPNLSAADLENPAPGASFSFPYCLRPPATPVPLGGSTIYQIYKAKGVPLDADSLHRALTTAGKVLARSLSTLKVFVGLSGGSDSGFIATENARKFLRDNPGLTFGSLQPKTRVYVNSGEGLGTVPIREGVDIGQAKKSIEVVPGVKRVEQAVVAELIGDQKLAPDECQLSTPEAWPVQVEPLQKALADLETLRPANVKGADPTRVLVVDTGYDPKMGKPAIDSKYLVRISSNGSAARYWVVNPGYPEESDVPPPDQLDVRAHGGEVAATLLGGRFMPEDRSPFAPPSIAFLSIVALDRYGLPYLDATAINSAFQIARLNSVRLINTSVAGQRYADQFLALMGGQQDQLIVAAAGNVARGAPQGFSLADSPWPGGFGGEIGNAKGVVVSVGAHDPDGRLLWFSRKGAEVDLLAPGCRIATYTLKGGTVQPVERSGTSYAAPLVSFVAARLLQAGLSPVQVKERLVTTVDVDEDVARASFSGGRLNALKALSIWRDVLTYDERQPDGSDTPLTAVGRLQTPHSELTVCGIKLTQGQLRKLVRSDPRGTAGGTSYWRGWVEAASFAKRLESCPATPDAVRGDAIKMERNDGSEVTVPVAKIRDFTRRLAGLSPDE